MKDVNMSIKKLFLLLMIFFSSTNILANTPITTSSVTASQTEYYSLNITGTGNVEFTMDADLSGDFYLYDTDLNLITSKHGSTETVLQSLSSGQYTIKLQPHPSYPLKLTIFGKYVAYHPGVASNLKATDGIGSTVNIIWTTVIGATYYELYRSESSTSNGSIIDILQTNSFIDNAVIQDILYYYRVKSCNDFGCSDYSKADRGYIGTISEPINPAIIMYILN
jgi:hypothetical protein